MTLNKEPFVRYNEEKKADTFTIRMTEDFDRAFFESLKKLIHQKKDSTAMKQLAMIGSEVLHDKKTMRIVDIITNNKRKNKKIGVADFD